MKAEKMREWNLDEMKNKEREFSGQLFKLKFQFAGGQSDTLAKIRELRKDLARVKTLRHERELEAREAKVENRKS